MQDGFCRNQKARTGIGLILEQMRSDGFRMTVLQANGISASDGMQCEKQPIGRECTGEREQKAERNVAQRVFI